MEGRFTKRKGSEANFEDLLRCRCGHFKHFTETDARYRFVSFKEWILLTPLVSKTFGALNLTVAGWSLVRMVSRKAKKGIICIIYSCTFNFCKISILFMNSLSSLFLAIRKRVKLVFTASLLHLVSPVYFWHCSKGTEGDHASRDKDFSFSQVIYPFAYLELC